MADVKFRGGKYLVPGTIIDLGNGTSKLKFRYNKAVLEEVKAFEGAKWNPDDKSWIIKNTPRNQFQLTYLLGGDPYKWYDRPLLPFSSERPLREHQINMVQQCITYHQHILAAEMGCIDGKAIVHCNRAGRGFEMTIEKLFYWWDTTLPTYIRSLCNGELRLNRIINVLHKGYQRVVKLTTSLGKTLIMTPDHEICIDGTNYRAVSDCSIGDTVQCNGRWLDKPHEETIIGIEDAGRASVFDIVCDNPYRNFVANGIIVHNCGKSLSAIETIEHAFREYIKLTGSQNGFEAIWVAPKSALRSVELECMKWECKIPIKFHTYESLKKLISNWPSGKKAPFVVIFDESSRVKTPTAQRTVAAMHLANSIRQDWGMEGYIIEMSGTPAPKSPADWWSQCFSKDTWVLTSQGPRQISELQRVKSFVYHGEVKYSAPIGSFPSGQKQLFEIVTKEGYKLKVTEGQKLQADYSGIVQWQELNKLSIGDKLRLHNHRNLTWEGYGSYSQGYLLGHVIGDGFWDGTYGGLCFFSDDYCVIPFVLSLLNEEHNCYPDSSDRITINSKQVHELCFEFGLTPTKEINALIAGASSDFACGLISAFFDTDGTVEHDRLRIALDQSDLPRLESIQRTLLYLGIPSRIYAKKEAASIINGRPINSGPRWSLTISGDHARTFYDRIGFNHPIKFMKLKENLTTKSQMSQDFSAEITAIKPLGVEEVWDISVDDIHAFSANGFVAHNCEIAQPGFIKEGTYEKFKKRLGLIVQKESITGGVYPHLVTWRDDTNKCDDCGELSTHSNHDVELSMMGTSDFHPFKPSVNEVADLYERMTGLVTVVFKKDCLDLPEKQYQIIRLTPEPSTLRAAAIINSRTTTVISAMTLLRELSDGFQYEEEECGTKPCPICHGSGEALVYQDMGDIEITVTDENQSWYPDTPIGDTVTIPRGTVEHDDTIPPTEMTSCPNCGGAGEIVAYSRTVMEVPTPKTDAVKDLLDQYDDVQRTVFFAGFSGSIDRLVSTVTSQKWNYIRVDGRGWSTDIPDCVGALNMLRAFQDPNNDRRIAFIGQPAAAGMGLTLTASPMICYYSNDFNAESRVQSEDRIHRMGMDYNRGATIYDLIHLPTDELVLNNLQKKRALQAMSMGEVRESLAKIDVNAERKF